MATPEAIHCIGCAKDISKSSKHRRKLVPDSTGNPVDGSFSSGSNCSNLLAIDTGNQKGAGEEHSKGSFHTPWKDGKNIPPSKERHGIFQLQAFKCVIL